ncbi:MAG: hypothetical protein MI975_29505 [Cytophagales bacterium]|nr:hypothetical protein [Cytophagales bacterium]
MNYFQKLKSAGAITRLLLVLCFPGTLMARELSNFSQASIYVLKNNRAELAKVVQVLREEVHKRSNITLKASKKLHKDNHLPQIILGLENRQHTLPDAWQTSLNDLVPPGPEGYKVLTLPDRNKIIVIANSKRGVLYGVGKLLRKMEIRENEVMAPPDLIISSTPAYEIRGHQLGYRPKTNAYDAWSVARFDQYIRELAIFGANGIEIMPPRTDDDFTSRHMRIPALEMIREQSRICDAYDLDVWMWYPNMGQDYTHPDSLAKELNERHEVFSSVPRLDHLFVPGGDPGDLEPDILFKWLETVSAVLHRYHPEAKIWVSPQVFRPTKVWLDTFYDHINKKPAWLGGVVFGPWIKTPLDEMREIVDKDIPIRRYPDITHSLSSQYPVPTWDLAYAITLGRECINPRPKDEKRIHNALDEYANGSLSYSEGTNDDVNKFVWSDQDWNPEIPVVETLRDYARFFINPDLSEELAQGFLGEERNIQGPLLTNDHVQSNLKQWQDIERKASEKMKSNFRFQMGLIRAYFDAYVQKRLIYETFLEQKALETLEKYDETGVEKAISKCKSILAEAWENPVDPSYKMRCEQLADDLFASIGAQLTIEKHGAMGGRGNFMDFIDNPLNDVAWIYAQLSRAEKASSEKEKKSVIDDILQRTNPGPGGFYDNFGSPSSWQRLTLNYDLAKDPGSLRTPRFSFGVGLQGKEWVHEITARGFEGKASPMAWMHQVTTLYDLPLQIRYEDLDPNASYSIRVAYTGRFRSRMKMTADGIEVHDFIETGVRPVYEFEIPQEALDDGEVEFSWTCGEAERGAQVSEVWIIKK